MVCADDPGVAALVAQARDRGLDRPHATAAPSRPTSVLLELGPAARGARVRARLGGDELALRLAVPGEHMALNALGAALAAGSSWARTADCLTEGSPRSTGCGAGSSSRAAPAASRVYDDYAHHPTEVAAHAARGPGGGRRRPGRRRLPAAPLLADADVRRRLRRRAGPRRRGRGPRRLRRAEDPQPGVTGALVADAVPLPPERVHYVPRWAEVPAVLAGLAARATWCSRWARAT